MWQFGLTWSSIWLRRKEVGLLTGGSEKVGRDDAEEEAEKSARSSSEARSGSAASMGTYL